ncbi:MAG TPA: BatA domain-containing protein [Humisphaera sp.]
MFANPHMLVGLALAVLPIVVHLLSRARYRSVDWGAMMFLEGADAAQATGRRFNQWVLLLIRAGIVALLALALARPEWYGRYSSVAPSGAARKQVAVLLLDCSASMGFEENGRTRIAAARDAAKQVLGLHRGDRVSLVLMGREQPEADRAPTADLWELGRRLESADAGTGRADIPRALEEAADAVAAAAAPRPGSADPAAAAHAEGTLATFYVVADRQADNWKRALDLPGGEWAAGWRKRLAQAGVTGRIVVIPVGSAEAANVAVTGVALVDPPAVAGHPLEFDVTVQNRGPVQWAQLPLTVTVDRRAVPVSEQKVNLAPDQSATFRVQAKSGFTTAGTHVVTAEVNRASGAAAPASAPAAAKPPGAGLAADDRFDLIVDVRDPVRVLVLSGDEPPPAPEKGAAADRAAERTLRVAEYLSAALAPFRAARKEGIDPCAVEVAYAEQWAGPTVRLSTPGLSKRDAGKDIPLSQFEVVVLANLDRPTEAQAQALERYVEDGGGLLVAPGEGSRVDDLDAALFADGAGLLPASLAEPTPPDWVDQTTLLGFEPHPALRFLGGRPDAFLPAMIGRRCPVNRLGPQARVVMRYATGEPFLVEAVAPAGTRRGKVLLLTTSLDTQWSTLPLTGFYVPFVQSAVRYLAEAQPRDLNVAPGEPIELPLPETGGDGRVVRVKPPDADERSAEVVRVGGRVLARYADTESPGIYQVRVTEPGRRQQTVQVAVNAPRDESNLTSLSPEQWARLERDVDVQTLDPAVTPITAAAATPAPFEVWPYALAGVFLLGLAEMKLARSWSRTEGELS